MGGAVNIVTGGVDDGPSANLNVTAGSGNHVRTNLVLRNQIKNSGVRIHIGHDTSDGFPLSADFESTSLENGDNRDNSDSQRTDLNAKVYFGKSSDSQWSLNIGNSFQKKGLPSSIYEPRFWRFKRWNRTSVDLDGEPIRKKTFHVKTKLYVERFLNELIDYRDNTYDPTNVFWISTHDNRSAGVLVSSSYLPGNNGITNFGIQMRWNESRRRADTGKDWFLNRTSTNWLFVEHERAVVPYIVVRSGISGHFFFYDSWKKISPSINPSLHIDWQIDNVMVTGSISRASRFPTLHQLYSSTSGNPDLLPEWALNSEVTVSYTLTGVGHLICAGFLSSVHDMINRSGRLAIYHNIEEAQLKGIELSGEISFPRADLYSSLSLLDARDGDGEKLEYRPSWKVDSSLYFTIHEDIRLHVFSQVVGQRKTETGSILKSYHRENAGITFGGERSYNVSLHLNNIFDTHYEEEMGFPMAGRTVWIGIEWNMKEKQTEQTGL
jgi:iron complex outermembrane receptor protein